MFCTEKERKTCNVEKMGCEGCFYNNDINKLKEMLGKRPDELEGETLKLFEAIMKIVNERDELKAKNKELEVITNGIKVLETNSVNDDTFYVIAKTDFLKGSYKQLLDDYIPKSKVIEKVIEIKNKPVKDEFITSTQGKLDTIIAIEELLESED